MSSPQPFTWPPSVEDMALDLKVDLTELTDADRARMGSDLAAAIAKVSELRGSSFDFADDLLSALPVPTADITLGVIRLAGRWFHRRRSPDGLIGAGELGTSRIPAFDADIERLLGIGRYAGPVFA